jgi:hypothetical protein
VRAPAEAARGSGSARVASGHDVVGERQLFADLQGAHHHAERLHAEVGVIELESALGAQLAVRDLDLRRHHELDGPAEHLDLDAQDLRAAARRRPRAYDADARVLLAVKNLLAEHVLLGARDVVRARDAREIGAERAAQHRIVDDEAGDGELELEPRRGKIALVRGHGARQVSDRYRVVMAEPRQSAGLVDEPVQVRARRVHDITCPGVLRVGRTGHEPTRRTDTPKRFAHGNTPPPRMADSHGVILLHRT